MNFQNYGNHFLGPASYPNGGFEGPSPQGTTIGPTQPQNWVLPNPILTSNGGQPSYHYQPQLFGNGNGAQQPSTYPTPVFHPQTGPVFPSPAQFQGPSPNGIGRSSPMALDHLRRIQQTGFQPNGSNGHGLGYGPNYGSGLGHDRAQSQGAVYQGFGQSAGTHFPMFPGSSGQYTLVDTQALTQLLRERVQSNLAIPHGRSLTRFQELKSVISPGFFESTGAGSHYSPVSSRRVPDRPTPDWLAPPRFNQPWARDSYADFGQNIGQQQRPVTPVPANRTVWHVIPRDYERDARERHYRETAFQNLRPPRPRALPPSGSTFRFRPPMVQLPVVNQPKKLGLQGVDSLIDADQEPIEVSRRCFSDHGRRFRDSAPKPGSGGLFSFNWIWDPTTPAPSGPPTRNDPPSFSHLTRGIPTQATGPDLSKAGTVEDGSFVANLPGRVSQIEIQPKPKPEPEPASTTTFSPFLPEEATTEPAEKSESVEFQELFRKQEPEVPAPGNQNQNQQGWTPVVRTITAARRRKPPVVPLENGSMLEKAIAPKLTDYRTNNRTRSRRARSKMTYSTQERNRCRVTLTKDKYYCTPDIAELDALMDDDGVCMVQNFEVGHLEWGKIIFEGTFDVAGLNLDNCIDFQHKGVILYPTSTSFPPAGTGLNRPATLILEKVWYINPLTKREVRDPQKLKSYNYENILREALKANDGEFISYKPETGQWTFKVPQFVPLFNKEPPTSKPKPEIKEEDWDPDSPAPAHKQPISKS